jgi:hypothetical protein
MTGAAKRKGRELAGATIDSEFLFYLCRTLFKEAGGPVLNREKRFQQK